jgi:HTH-type transcriptional regulator/antitoxin HigA
MMNSSNNFQPNWVSTPGDTITDILSEKKLSLSNFARKMESSTDYINNLINGYVALTKEVSFKLEEVLGPPADFWLKRESQYREAVNRKKAIDDAWLKELPLKEMFNWGWLKLDYTDKLQACLDYFNVTNVSAWQKKYALEINMVSFRTSPSFKAQPASVAAWLRQGEIASENITCKPWNAALFRSTLKDIKKLTRVKGPNDFIPELKRLCADCGVAVAIVRTPSGCQASGVTKFIKPDRALLMLSFRYLTDDHFWFTFFHEAAHLLLHGNKAVFVEEIGKDKLVSKEENEANDFAAEQLISADLRTQLMKIPFSNKKAVIGFAILVGVSPGIVIGQLQHLGRIEHGKLNTYKRRYSWEHINQID